MALPIIKAKSYNYGSYANPQQVKFRKGIGAQIGDEFGAGLVKGMQEKRAEKKREEREIKKFNENVDEWGVKAKVSGLKELGPDATEKSRKQLSLAIDALRPERGDTVDDKVKKELALEKLFTDIRVMKKTQELDFDAKGKNLASSSQADFINGANAADGLYDMNFNKETLEMEFSIPEVDPYSGSKFPSISMKRIDPTSFLDKVSNLNTKYDSLELTDKLQLNDVTKAPKILKSLYENKKQQYSPLTKSIIQEDGSTDVYFDQSLVKDYLNSEDPNSQMGKFINGAVEVKGQTIWEDTLGKKGFDKNNPEHIAEVKDIVASDIAEKYSEYKLETRKPKEKEDDDGILSNNEIKSIYDSLKTKSGLNILLADQVYGPANNRKPIIDVEVSDKIKGGIFDEFSIVNLNLQEGRTGETKFESSKAINLKNKEDFAKLVRLTNAFGRGEKNIDAIIAQYDNYIK